MNSQLRLRRAELATLPAFADVPARDLKVLAACLEPLAAVTGDVLMRQGERAESFVIIASGRVEVSHVGPNDQVTVTELSSGTIVGEIALLRHAPRTATVIAQEDLRGYTGGYAAFDCMLAIRPSRTGWCPPRGSGWPPTLRRSRYRRKTAPR